MSSTDPTDRPAAENTGVETGNLEPPQGWLDDEDFLYLDYYWRGQPGDVKHLLQTAYGVPNAEPLVTRDPEEGDVVFLLRSRESDASDVKYYIWNGIEKSVCWIKAPTTLREIYRLIDEREGNLGALEVEVVKPGKKDTKEAGE